MTYANIPHLLFPIVTNPTSVIHVLRFVVKSMEDRYKAMAQIGARNIVDFNKWADKNRKEKLPFIVLVIDELSDLMLTVGKDLEDLITRIAQMARAAGIHLVVATQRPSVDVITGLIKVNFPSRIAFRVASRIDSRTILDTSGAEKLLGKGDMLFLDAANAYLQRVHGAYVSNEEIEQLVSYMKTQDIPSYHTLEIPEHNSSQDISQVDSELYNQVIDFLQSTEDVSISLLQRKFRIGYNRSARIIEMLEAQGFVMPPDGSKTRKVIH
jgi:S-DNA-T family DNA segregation ATPase FtsK/SpoIIIE